jgi:lipase chaperone LimK
MNITTNTDEHIAILEAHLKSLQDALELRDEQLTKFAEVANTHVEKMNEIKDIAEFWKERAQEYKRRLEEETGRTELSATDRSAQDDRDVYFIIAGIVFLFVVIPVIANL